jgi:hypothetical protein
MAYKLFQATGTNRLAFLRGVAIGMSKYDQPLSLERGHEIAEMFMTELEFAIEEIENALHKRYAVVDSAGCDCGTCRQIRKQQGRDPRETVASDGPESDWYDPIPQNPSLYRDALCNDHGDCAAIFRANAWRCVICGVAVTVSEPQEV